MEGNETFRGVFHPGLAKLIKEGDNIFSWQIEKLVSSIISFLRKVSPYLVKDL